VYKRISLVGAICVAALLFAVNAKSTPITTQTTANYNTWTSYLTGAPGEIQFPPQSSSYQGNQITISGFIFTGGPAQVGQSGPTAASINVSTPAGGETAMFFAAHQLNSTQPAMFNLSLSDGEIFSGLSGQFGFAAPVAITSATLSGISGASITLDDFFYGTSSQASTPTAETGTLLLTCGGLMILLGSARKLFRRASA
jgi:hypothetical protein